MRVLLKGLSPGVQHGQETDLGAKMFGICRKLQQRFRAGSKQELIDYLLVPEREPRKVMRQSKDDMEIADVQ